MSLSVEATEGKPQLSVGTHELKCINVEADEVESLREPNIWRFTFECEDELDTNGNPIEIDGIASRYLTPLSKAWSWCEALGMKLEVGKRHDLEDAIGGRALGKIIHKPSATGVKYARLDSLMPLPKGKAQSAPSAAQEARQPAEGDVVDADTVSAWWKDILGQGFERVKVIGLSKEMFEDRLPGELTAAELKGLTDQLNLSA